MKILSLLALLLLAATAHAEPVLRAQGQLEPLAARIAEGTVQIWEDTATGSQWVQFGEDYRMSSGVVLDLKVCGLASQEQVCLSQGEVRRLRGAYRMPIRQKLAGYTMLKIFDLDLVQDHARTVLDDVPLHPSIEPLPRPATGGNTPP